MKKPTKPATPRSSVAVNIFLIYLIMVLGFVGIHFLVPGGSLCHLGS